MKSPHTSLEGKHLPVMIDEVVKICNPKNGGIFMDCTFGAGGYSKEFLKFQETQIVAIDRDNQASAFAKQIEDKFKSRFTFHNEKFSNLNLLSTNKFDAVIFDLGLSSIQLDNLSRGFSFKSKDKLNMTMGKTTKSAKEVLNYYSTQDLRDIIKTFGEEEDATRIAKNIVSQRNKKELETTDELVEIIKKSKKKNYKKKIDVSTKTFQAIRIFVNQEISELIDGIIKATKILKPGGKLIVVSFHSIEDKIIKFYFKNFSKNYSRSNKYLPESNKRLSLFESYKNKIIQASSKEIKKNPRSRSAKLRFAIRSTDIFQEPNELRKKFKYLTDWEKRIARSKLLISIFVFSFLLFFTSIIKNKTRVIEKNIKSYEKKISYLEKELYESQLDFYYLTSPKILQEKISFLTNEEYNFMNISKIYLNIDNFWRSKKISKIIYGGRVKKNIITQINKVSYLKTISLQTKNLIRIKK